MTIKYTKDHEWIKIENGIATLGITQHAADALGELVYVELPETGSKFSKGEAPVVVESSKSASDVYIPVSGQIEAVNEDLVSNPENVNDSPYEKGWLIKIKLDPGYESDLSECLTEEQYEEFLKENE